MTNKNRKERPVILFLGKLPPPFIGPTIAAEIILNSTLKDQFRLIHLDQSDHRKVNTLARLDFTNFYLAFKQYVKMIYYIMKYKPDMVYIPFGQSTVSLYRDSIFVIISKLFRIKVITHLRGSNLQNWLGSSGKITKSYFRFIYKKIDAQIVLGEKLRNLFKPFLPGNKIFVVPNGGNFIFPAKIENSKRINMLFLGNLFVAKGVMDALYSTLYLKDYSDKFIFRFVGSVNDNSTQIRFDNFIEGNKDLHIELLKPATDQEKFRLLSEADIFVFPSHNEGHPWVILEAMAAGLPVITTDTGAITETIVDGENGFIVDKRRPEDIALKIKYLIDFPEIREQMAAESRRLYLKNFTEEKMVERLADVFNTVLKDKSDE